MGHAARNPHTAIGGYDPDFVARSAGDGSVQSEDQLTLTMCVQRHFRLMIREVKLVGDRREKRQVGIENGNGRSRQRHENGQF
jgi:hypothetical protein